MRKASRKTLKAKADRLFSQYIRNRGFCEWCGDVGNTLQTAHIFSRRFLVTRWEKLNSFCLCASCHFKAHHRPLEFAEFVKIYLGEEEYFRLMRKAKTSIKKINILAIIKKYQEII